MLGKLGVSLKEGLHAYIKSEKIKRPTSIDVISHRSRLSLVALSRGEGKCGASISMINVDTLDIDLSISLPTLRSPQGMVIGNDQTIWISDTLNRKAVQLNLEFQVIKTFDLASLSGEHRFLCRVPSRVDNEVWFPDYHSDSIVCFSESGARIHRLDTHKFGINHLRKVIPHPQGYFLIGRGSKELVEVSSEWAIDDDRVDGLESFKSVVDLVRLTDTEYLAVLKEEDDLKFMTVDKEF